ncbi:hypothetical protein [Levilactobacillus enshiensis]|uniref:hypothetical protein n=1 Tax=Levilactobacillus enshiensis TaxID=2590213 RepID=UPI00117AE088|nr:hypothetical protein [Levilactobacillus enshiensis]
MALSITQALTISATTKNEDGKVIANFYANVSPQGANNSLQMTVVDRDLFTQNMDTVKADLNTFIDDFTSKYTTA